MKPGNYTQMYVHLVFAVKRREAALTKEIRSEIFEYISGIITNMSHKSIIVNGRDFWGNVVVPFSGYSIMLNDSTFEWYGELINKYEGVELTCSNGNYFIEGVLQNKYVFTNDYLFLLGDNRHRSRDSRYWGFIPESNVIGKYFLSFPR